jgi:hypothetical protein
MACSQNAAQGDLGRVLLKRDALGAHQATLVQLKEAREDLSMILESGVDLG